MNKMFVVFFIGLFIFIYGIINFYIGLRGWQAFGTKIPWLSGRVYWVIFWALALSYLAGRAGEKFLPAGVTYVLTVTGAYWLAAMFYFFPVLVAVDMVRLLDRWLGFLPGIFRNGGWGSQAASLLVLFSVVAIIVYGSWNARHPRVQRYDITIPKTAGSVERLHAVMVSDIHLGEIIHNGRLTQMVDMINKLNPEIVLLPGDIIDENIGPFVEQRMMDTFRRLHPKYGMYAVPGNHEYIGGHIDEAVHYLREAGVQVLSDRYVKIADSFYVVGRDDGSMHGSNRKKRRELAAVMAGIDKSLPVILLSHQPINFEESRQNGVDLQLSGHTHAGQLYPNRLITRRIYENDWGYYRKDTLQVIVSSGFGTWGPPIRVGNTPEIVDIRIKFAD